MEHPRTDDATQPAAGLDLSDESQRTVAVADLEDGKIVAIESGRQKRDGRASGDRQRGDRTERRERRKQRTGDETADQADDALAVADGSAMPQESVAELAASGKRVLTAPLVSTDEGTRAHDRAKSHLESAERAVATHPEIAAVVAPLVRHVNTVTEQFNETQINMGRVMAERDALRMKVAELQGIDVSEVSVMPAAHALPGMGSGHQLHALDISHGNGHHEPATPSKKLIPASLSLSVGPHATHEEVQRVARRRQLIAACLFAAAGIGLVIAQRQGNDISKISRDSLSELQFVGIFFNVFFMVWMLYRVVRVGGKGANWLFPKEQSKRRR